MPCGAVGACMLEEVRLRAENGTQSRTLITRQCVRETPLLLIWGPGSAQKEQTPSSVGCCSERAYVLALVVARS